jgi:CBS domain-containing membrane protein
MLDVADIMTREPYTLGPDNTLAEVRTMMAEHHIRHVPVVNDEGRVIGIVSQRDVLAAGDSTLLQQGRTSLDVERLVALSAIMSSPVRTVPPEAGLRATALLLHQHRIGCLPVLDGHNLVGIITDADFVAVAINLMEQLEYSEPLEDLDPDADD